MYGILVHILSFIYISSDIPPINASFLLLHSWDHRSVNNFIDSSIYVIPPNLPERFYTEFTLFYTPRDDDQMPLPPWPQNYPPQLPYAVGRGRTWYALDLNIAIEYYQDYCVPIFEPSSYFPCMIFNYNQTAYLMAPTDSGYGPCCVYRKPWGVPHQNFMQTFTHYYSGTTERLGSGVLNQTIQWWVIPKDDDYQNEFVKQKNISRRNNHPVFGGYGWTFEKSKKRTPVCFWYEGNTGWAQQLFFNFVDNGPRIHDVENFQLPEICKTEITCIYRP
ncbi:unnamed protein product [Trichobilharzia szidati]|nr:unnamed protein product [Trichobilharzia szidati]